MAGGISKRVVANIAISRTTIDNNRYTYAQQQPHLSQQQKQQINNNNDNDNNNVTRQSPPAHASRTSTYSNANRNKRDKRQTWTLEMREIFPTKSSSQKQ